MISSEIQHAFMIKLLATYLYVNIPENLKSIGPAHLHRFSISRHQNTK